MHYNASNLHFNHKYRDAGRTLANGALANGALDCIGRGCTSYWNQAISTRVAIPEDHEKKQQIPRIKLHFPEIEV